MSDKIGFSELECKIIMSQIERRARNREMFLKLRTDPCLNAKESGYVFDPAVQRFLSMKVSELEHFTPSYRSIKYGLIGFIPMFIYGYMLWEMRETRERAIRCGELKYKDRLFKFQ